MVNLGIMYMVTSATLISSAPTTLGIDKETYRDSEMGRPIIPGPTVKGVLRTASCYAARELGLSCCGSKKPEDIERIHIKLRNTVTINGRRYCHVCALFGAPGLSSAIMVGDAQPLSDMYRLSVRPGVEIDDYTLTAREARLYYYEVIEPGSLFLGEITIDTEILKSRGILCDAIRLLLKGLSYVEAVGVGHGLVKPFIKWIKIGERIASSPEKAASLLQHCRELEPLFRQVWAPSVIRLAEV